MRELFYYRHPGDAPVKVGSEREFASRQRAPTHGVVGIDGFLSLVCPRGPSKIGAVVGIFTPKKIPIGRWDLAARQAPKAKKYVKRAKSKEIRPPYFFVFLAQIIGFLCPKFHLWATQHRPGAVVFPGVLPGYKIDTFLKDFN